MASVVSSFDELEIYELLKDLVLLGTLIPDHEVASVASSTFVGTALLSFLRSEVWVTWSVRVSLELNFSNFDSC